MNRTLDKQAYANLLAEAQPKVIETESENERKPATPLNLPVNSIPGEDSHIIRHHTRF